MWTYMDLYGLIWTYMDLYNIWTYMVVYGLIWTYMVVYGLIWTYMYLYGLIWTYMDSCGHPFLIWTSAQSRISCKNNQVLMPQVDKYIYWADILVLQKGPQCNFKISDQKFTGSFFTIKQTHYFSHCPINIVIDTCLQELLKYKIHRMVFQQKIYIYSMLFRKHIWRKGHIV